MDIKAQLEPPHMPNFARLKKDHRIQRKNGTTVGVGIADFSEKEAEEYGELMKQTFIQHWKKKQQ